MNNPKKILIVGFGDAMNYGGEAIVHGTLRMIFEVWPSARVSIATINIGSALNAFSHYPNVDIIQSQRRFSPYRIVKGLLRRLGIGSGSPVRVNTRIVDGHDIVLSVGGDNFVQTPDKGISILLDDLMRIGERALAQGSLYCLWGASVGPFDDLACFQKISQHLKKASLIIAREKNAVDYLKKLGCETNVVMAADPAFLMEPSNNSIITLRNSSDEIVIGVNLSLLALDYMKSPSSGQTTLARLSESVNALFEIDERVRVILIPHVMSSVGGPQDDYQFLNDLACIINSPTRLQLLPHGLGSLTTKALMKQCDVVVAARMHCFVGSVSAGTPALMIAYSDKGYGMTRYTYGNEQHVLTIDKLTPELLRKHISQMLADQSQLNDYLRNQRPLWQQDARKAITALQQKFNTMPQA